MSGSLIRIRPLWTNTMGEMFFRFFVGKIYLPSVVPADFAQDYERTVCSGKAGRDAHFIEYHRHTGERGAAKCSFFGAFLPQERQASESASGLAFVRDCKSKRRLHVA